MKNKIAKIVIALLTCFLGLSIGVREVSATSGYTLASSFSPNLLPCLVIVKPELGLRYRLVSDHNTPLVLKQWKDGYTGPSLLMVKTLGQRWNGDSSSGCKSSSTNPNPDEVIVQRKIVYGSGSDFDTSSSKDCTPGGDTYNTKFCKNYKGEVFFWTFSCMDPGKDAPKQGLKDSETEVKLLSDAEVNAIKDTFVDAPEARYDYYEVIAHPSGDYQRLKGVIRVKKKAYILRVDAGAGTTVRVTRSRFGSTTDLFNGTGTGSATIYEGEVLSITMSLSSGYAWTSHIVEGKDLNNTTSTSLSHTVGGDVRVTTRAKDAQTKYILSIDKGTGTGIKVQQNRYTNGVYTSWSNIYEKNACNPESNDTSKKDIYGGDKLNVYMSVCSDNNYYWSSSSFSYSNGSSSTSTNSKSIENHVVASDISIVTRAVQKYRLYAKAVDITTGKEITTNVTNTDSGLVVKGNVATVSRPTVTGGYKFLGWYTAKTTDKSRLTGASDTTYKVSNISANTTVYAFYVKEWTLTKTQGTGTTITVTRSESLYGGGSTGTANLASGTTLYQGDKISATFGVDVGYSWGSHSFVGKDINNTANTTISNHIVGANVTVTTTASQNKYKLTAKAVDVTTKTLISGIADTISSEVTHNQEATVSRPTASGYKFLGWSTSANANKNALTNADKDSYSMTLTSNATVYAYYVKEWKLTISAGTGTTITVNRITSTYGGGKTGALASGAILYQGDVIGAVISKGDAYSWGTHSFVYWDANGNKQSDTTNTTISKHTVGSDVTVSAEAVENTFQGKVDAGTATTGWKDANNTQYYEIANCSPTDGCKVTFTHSLKRAGGKGKVSYTITRESNYSSVSSSDSLKTGTFNSNTASTVFTDSNLTLYPGQTVCETLIFEPRATSSNKATLKVCALALGKTQPDTPTDTSTTYNPGDNANAFINMHVKNTSNSKYNTYQKEVYAKPGDSLTYRAIYNPVLQYTYNLIPQQMRINGGTIYSGNGTALGTLFNSKKGSSLKNWNNAFSVNSAESSFTTLFNQNYTSNLGATTKQTKENEHAVLTSEVGKVLKETAKTNLNDNTKTTPSQIVFTRNGNNVLGNVITSSLESSAEAKVPYNFNTDVKITTDSGETLNAGETKVINYEIDILPKINSLTTNGTESEAYATMVRDAMSKVIIYTIKSGEGEKAGTVFDSSDLCSYYTNRDSCWYESEKKYDGKDNSYLNVEGNTLGQVYDKLQTSINVSDVDAGYKFCVAVALYPASSGSDDNLNASGSNTWRISNSKCFSVGKRPTFQVWGGSFYAANDVATSTTAKRSLNGLTMDGGLIVFSSWVENAVVSNGKVTGLASGAAAGLSNNAVKGGSLESSESYCKYRVPLSLANYARSQLLPLCSGTGDAGATGYSGIVASTNKESLTDPLPEEVSIVREYNDGAVVNFDTTDVEETTIRHMGNNLTINETTIATGKTHIVKAAGNITIVGNVYYNTASYNALTQVPKLLIYAKGNITINCGVREIDAMIIAEGNVNTCNSGDINSEANSNPLVVNGAIITKSLTFNRTFGAATGLYSKIPAEIVNYDTSIILWGRGKVNTEDYGAVYQVYQHELAPRY